MLPGTEACDSTYTKLEHKERQPKGQNGGTREEMGLEELKHVTLMGLTREEKEEESRRVGLQGLGVVLSC